MHCDFTMGPKPLWSRIWIPTYYAFTRNIQEFSILNGSEFLNKCRENIIRMEMEIQIWLQNKFEPLCISSKKKTQIKIKKMKVTLEDFLLWQRRYLLSQRQNLEPN